MKVLHLISGGDKGGAKTHVFTLLTALQEEIDINVICFMEGVFYNEIKQMPIPSMLLKQKYRNDLTIIKPLISHIKKEGYNLIHAHGARANFLSLFIRPFIKIPIISTVHSDYRLDFTDSFYKRFIYTGLNILALKQIDYYIAISNNFKKMLVERNFSEKDIYTAYNTIDFEIEPTFVPKEEFFKKYNIDAEGKTVVGIVGRFDYVKGNDIFIKAAHSALKVNPDMIFLLVGEGSEETSLIQLANKLGIRDKLVFTGFVDDVWSLFNALDIHVISSRSESFPYVMLEGAMMKKATVSSDVGGIGDLIIENKTGLLAPALDHETMAEKILALAKSKELREELGENLYNFAKSNFSKESMKRRHIDIYKDILKRRKDENRLFDIALFGYYGYNNSGDDALLKSIVSSLKKEKEDVKILILSKKPKETSENLNIYSIHRYNIFEIFKYLKITRLFVFGGGSLIQDVTSTRSLLYYIFLLKLSKHYGAKLMVYGNGIGPIIKEKNVLRSKKALEICDYISLRDPESLTEIRRLGVENKNVHISVDPVFSINMEKEKDMGNIFQQENIDLTKQYFTVSIRQWKSNEIDFTTKMAETIDYVHEKYNLTPIYLPMQASDLFIIKEVMAKTHCPHILINKVHEISQVMEIISITQFAMCMRLHALIYAASMGVPVIGLVYDPKVKNFVEYINQDSYMETSHLDVPKLKAIVDEVMENRDTIAENIKQESEKLRELSGKDAKVAIQLCE